MKKMLIQLIVMLLPLSLCSQSLEIKNLIVDNFPEMKIVFVAKDASGKEIRTPQLGGFIFTENDQNKNINIFCGPPSQSKFSLIFLIDLSASMFKEGIDNTKPVSQTNPRKIDLMTNAITSSMRSLPPKDKWECSIIGFSCDVVEFMQFTNDTNLVKQGVDSASRNNISSATDYDAAFLFSDQKNLDGALPIAKNKAKNKPTIIFITDGVHSPCNAGSNPRNPAPRTTIWTNNILDEAKKGNVTIYTLSLALQMPSELKTISNSSPPAGQLGGMDKWFELISSQNELKNDIAAIYQNISTIGGVLPPCEFTWLTDCSSTGAYFHLEIPQLGLIFDSTYVISASVKPSLEIAPKTVSFMNPSPTLGMTKTMTLTARNNYVIVDGLMTSNPKFTVTDFPGQVRIGKDSSLTVTLKYLSPDSSFSNGFLTAIAPSACIIDTAKLYAGWLVLKDVHCGNTTIGTQKLYDATGVLCNNTGFPVKIKNMVIKNGNSSSFSIVNSVAGQIINNGKCVDVQFKFTPTSQDSSKSIIEVTTDGDFVITSVIDGYAPNTSYLEIDQRTVTFPETLINVPIDKQITLSSKSGYSDLTGATISNPKFTVSDWGGKTIPFRLEKDSTLFVQIRYLSSSTDSTTATLKFECGGCDSSEVILVASAYSGVEELVNNADDIVNIYPNPANDYVNFVLPNNEPSSFKINIYDVYARKVKEENVNNIIGNLKISVKEIPDGVYLLVLNYDSKIYSLTFIVRK